MDWHISFMSDLKLRLGRLIVPLVFGGLLGGMVGGAEVPLKTVKDILQLERSAALSGLPVELRGVAVVHDPAHDALYLNDYSGRLPATVRVRGVTNRIPIYSVVDLRGHTTAGFAPEVQVESMVILGEGNRPPPAVLALDDLKRPEMESQWVDTVGTMLVWRPQGAGAYFEAGVKQHRITGYLVDLTGIPPAEEMINRSVRLAGICTVVTNELNQYRDLRLVVSRRASLGLSAPASIRPPLPLDVGRITYLLSQTRLAATNNSIPEPERNLASDILRYGSTGGSVSVEGVLLHQSGSLALYLQDHSGPIRVYLKHPRQLEPGDLVRASGQPKPEQFRPVLASSEVTVLARTNLPAPQEVRDIGAVGLDQDARRVTVRGTVIGYDRLEDPDITNHLAVLESGSDQFKAVLPEGMSAEEVLPMGAQVQLTGVCKLRGNPYGQVRGFDLLLTVPADIVLLARPPLLPSRQLARVMRLIIVVGLLVALWIGILKWQVKRQTKALKATNQELHNEVQARQRAEGEARAALAKEKDLVQLKSNFVSMVSHEFRTPLGVIQSSSDILDRYLDRLPAEKRSAQLRSIRKAVRRMSELMEEVLHLARFDNQQIRCQRAMVDIGRLCRRCIGDVSSATEGKCPIELSMDPPAFKADIDENLVVHMLVNVLGNAVKYSPAGSPVGLAVRKAPGQLILEVQDHGCGIPAADQTRLFSGFFRGSNIGSTPGSGLGLVIVKRCVDLHGGNIRVDSEEGRGTTLCVELPIQCCEPVTEGSGVDTEVLLRSGFGNTEFLIQPPPPRLTPPA